MFSDIVESLKGARFRHDLLYLFLFALFLRSIYFVIMLTQIGSADLLSISPDCKNYVLIANGFPSILVQPDNMLYTFGPGYGFFIATSFFIFGQSGIPVIIMQILLSSLSCLLIYKLGKMLTGSYAVSLTAGIIAAVSYTSISLSNIILSDSVYFFFFLLSLILFLHALKKDNTNYFMLSGLLVGYSVLTRSIGQFWIIAMIAIAVAAYMQKKPTEKQLLLTFRRYFKRPLIGIAIAVGIVLFWVLRNWIVIGVPNTTSSSIGGVGKVAAITMERVKKNKMSEVNTKKYEHSEESEKHAPENIKDKNQTYPTEIREILFSYPSEFMKTYLQLVWGNVRDINYIPRIHFPDYKDTVMKFEYRFLKRFQINYMPLILSLIGLTILIFRHQYYAAFVLGLTFFYYVVLVGFGRWQGSRLFYPAQISWAVLSGISLVALVQLAGRALRSISGRKQSRVV